MTTQGQACKILAGTGWACGYFRCWDLWVWPLLSCSVSAKPGPTAMAWRPSQRLGVLREDAWELLISKDRNAEFGIGLKSVRPGSVQDSKSKGFPPCQGSGKAIPRSIEIL